MLSLSFFIYKMGVISACLIGRCDVYVRVPVKYRAIKHLRAREMVPVPFSFQLQVIFPET